MHIHSEVNYLSDVVAATNPSYCSSYRSGIASFKVGQSVIKV